MSKTNPINEETENTNPKVEIWDKQHDEQYQEFLEHQIDAYLWNY